MIKFKMAFGLLLWLMLFVLNGASYANPIESSLTLQKPSLILLKEYRSDLDVTGWLLSEKLDGVRAYWDGEQLLSRNGNVFFAPEWFTKNFPPFELDGELWIDRDKFQETVSVVTRHQPEERWHNVTYQIFEAPNQQGGLLARLSVLKAYLKAFPIPYLKIIPQVRVKNQDEVAFQLQRVLALKGEGLVLRKASVLYHTGRSCDAVKVKQKQDSECLLLGYTAGKGKYQGLVGAFKCQLLEGTFLKLRGQVDRVIKVGSGLTDALRKDPPKIGSLITFQYMGLTQKGLPRFPVFLRIKVD